MNTIAKLGAVVLFAACGVAQAANITGNMSVAATVATPGGTCTSLAIGSINFGIYSGAQIVSPGGVQVTCSQGLPFSITATSMNVGTGGMMIDGAGHSLGYDITLQGGASIMLPAGAPSPSPLGGTGTGAAQYFPVDGVLYGSQGTIPGNYQDTAVITVTF